MAKVGIVMGSDSDMPVMAKAADVLEKLGIDYEMTIISAHREPDVFFEYAKTLKMTKKDFCDAIDMAPQIKPHRHTFLHEEKYRTMAKQIVNEDEILKGILL